MSKLHYKALIEDCVNDKCSTAEQEQLLAIYGSTVKRLATTLARKASYELADFAGAKEQGIDGFSLVIEKQEFNDGEHWVGVFKNGHKNLKIIARLEK